MLQFGQNSLIIKDRSGRVENIWDVVCDELGIRFLSLRHEKAQEWQTGEMSWEDMSAIVGRFEIASSDAMIINLFLNSEFPALVTADAEIVYVLNKISPHGKCVIVPDRMS